MTDQAQKSSKTHLVRGGIIFALGAVVTFLLMANEKTVWHGPLWGILSMAIACVGMLDLLGLLAPTATMPTLGASLFDSQSDEPAWMSPKFTAPAALLIGLLGGALLGYRFLPFSILAALAVLLPSALRRPGLLVFVIASGIMLPMLGAYGLWDPWETHYGEVAREILSRDDWISLWWAQEDWFWSKPIFIFWANALTMGALGVDPRPDAHPAHPEWALRMPVFLCALMAVMAVYAAISRVYGKRAGALSALVLCTMPHFFMLSHQAITDMYVVSTLTISMCFFVVAVTTDAAREIPTFRLGPVAVSVKHVMIFVFTAVSLAQILYLASRNVTMVEGFRFAWHGDHFLFGSGNNGNVPGNKPLSDQIPAYNEWMYQPFAQAIYWAIGLVFVLFSLRRTKTIREIAMFGFYFFAAFAFMAKALLGPGVAGLVTLLFLISSGRWKLLFEGHLKIGMGLVTVLVTGAPWFVAMFMRHGPAFTDRLLIHDQFNRVASGVHGDTGAIDYFMAQLGYAMFPWVALAPAALTIWLRLVETKPGEGLIARLSAPLLAIANPAKNTEDPALARKTAMRDLAFGAAFMVLALVFTVATYDSTTGGGRFVLCWAAMGFGAMLALKGLFTLTPVSSGGALAIAGGGIVDESAELTASETSNAVPADEARAKIDTAQIIGLWFVTAFTLFSAMVTKFHHYIFPAVPPTAILIGLLVDRMFGDEDRVLTFRDRILATLAACVSPVFWVLGVAGLFGDPRGIIPFETPPSERANYIAQHAWSFGLSGFLIVLGALLAYHAVNVFIGAQDKVKGQESPSSWTIPGIALALATAPIVSAFVGRDLAWVTGARPAGYERLIHLFVYNYGRPWPDVFDYRPILTGFAAVATVLFALGVFDKLRAYAIRGVLGLAIFFSVWCLDVYLIDLSPHWSQSQVIDLYYKLRKSSDEPVLAFQMNWKGENFYTGNRVYVFADIDTAKVRDWIAKNSSKSFYCLLEHSRLESFKTLLGGRNVEKVTDMKDNNKFLMIHVSAAN